jgi:hypothetical protein
VDPPSIPSSQHRRIAEGRSHVKEQGRTAHDVYQYIPIPTFCQEKISICQSIEKIFVAFLHRKRHSEGLPFQRPCHRRLVLSDCPSLVIFNEKCRICQLKSTIRLILLLRQKEIL